MAESSKKMEPWQLILILILVLAFFGGLYIVNQTIASQVEALENVVESKTESIKSSIDNVNRRLDLMKSDCSRAAAGAPAAAAPATAEGEGETTAEPAEAEASAGSGEEEKKE